MQRRQQSVYRLPFHTRPRQDEYTPLGSLSVIYAYLKEDEDRNRLTPQDREALMGKNWLIKIKDFHVRCKDPDMMEGQQTMQTLHVKYRVEQKCKNCNNCEGTCGFTYVTRAISTFAMKKSSSWQKINSVEEATNENPIFIGTKPWEKQNQLGLVTFEAFDMDLNQYEFAGTYMVFPEN